MKKGQRMNDWYNLRFRRLMTAWSSKYSKDPSVNSDSVLPTLDADAWAEFLADAGVQVFSTHARSHQGYLLFPGKSGPPDPMLGSRDFFADILAACHRRDIKTVGMMQICPDICAGMQHPSWCQMDAEGNKSLTGDKLPWYMCFNNPQRARYFLAQVEEVVRRYPSMDGIMFDEFRYWGDGKFCYCEHCQDQFKEQFGREPPRQPDFNDPLWIDFLNWRVDSATAFFKKLHDLIRSINPNLPITIIFYAENWYPPRWLTGQSGSGLAPFLDYISQDRPPSSMLYESEMFKYYKALKPGAVPEHILDFYMNLGVPRQSVTDVLHGTPEALAIASAGTGMAVGAAAGIDFATGPGGIPSGKTAQVIKAVMAHTRKIEEWLAGAKPVGLVGLVSSEKTADYYGRESQSRWVSSYLGAYKAMLDSHLVFNVVPIEMNKTFDNDMRVIFLPNIVCLSDSEAERIRNFVKEGGGLVATYATGLCDERGKTRKNFALADVFGADYLSGIEEDRDFLDVADPECRPTAFRNYSISVSEHEITKDMGAFDFNLLLCSVLKVQLLPRAQGLAFLDSKAQYGRCPMIQLQYGRYPTKERASVYPTVAVNQYGKGRVAYLPAKVDAQYAINAHPWTRRLIKQALAWAARTRMPIELDAPMSVEINIHRRIKPERLIIHLVNFQSAASRTMTPFAGSETTCNYLVEEILPVFDLKLRISPELSGRAKEIYLVPGRIPLNSHKDKQGWLEIAIPRVDIHAMVVLE